MSSVRDFAFEPLMRAVVPSVRETCTPRACPRTRCPAKPSSPDCIAPRVPRPPRAATACSRISARLHLRPRGACRVASLHPNDCPAPAPRPRPPGQHPNRQLLRQLSREAQVAANPSTAIRELYPPGTRIAVFKAAGRCKPASTPKDDQALAPIANQPLRTASTERPTAAQEKDGFQQGSLSRTIPAPNQIVSGIQLQLCALNAAHVIDGKLNEAHCGQSSLEWDREGASALERTRCPPENGRHQRCPLLCNDPAVAVTPSGGLRDSPRAAAATAAEPGLSVMWRVGVEDQGRKIQPQGSMVDIPLCGGQECGDLGY